MNRVRNLMSVALLGTSLCASAGTVDTFEDRSNPNRWTFGSFTDEILARGGNPGGWLHGSNLSTFNPAVLAQAGMSTQEPPVWKYFWERDKQVRRITFDATTLWIAFNTPYGPAHRMSVMFVSRKGTPDPLDDDWVFFVGPEAPPAPGEGWKHYTFDIPSKYSQALPPGWQGGWSGDVNNLRRGVSWQDVLMQADEIRIHWFNPKLYYILNEFDVGVDNIIFETEDLSAPPGKL